MLIGVLGGYAIGPSTSRESSLALLAVLVILSFPAGLLGAFAVGFISDITHGTAMAVLFDNAYLEAIITWGVITTVGWIQWFVLLPWLVRRIKAYASNSAHPAA